MQEIFSTLGPVGEINIITDRSKGLSAGYGFVQYLDLRTAEMALHLLDGRVLHGQVCPTKRPRTHGQRSGWLISPSHCLHADKADDRVLFPYFWGR